MRVLVGSLVAVALVALLAWALRREPVASPAVAPVPAVDTATRAPVELAPVAAEPRERVAGATEPEVDDQTGARARSTSAPVAPRPAAAPPTESARRALVLRWVQPDQSLTSLKDVRVRFKHVTGQHPTVTFALRGLTANLDCELFVGTWLLNAEADGHRHRPEVVEVVPGDDPDTLRVVFWPSGWIPVVVRTPDGRPFESLATDLGLHPKRFFDGAFTVRAGRGRTRDGEPLTGTEELVTFRPPRGYQVTSIGDDAVGSLELHAAPPFDVGLYVHGRFLASELLRPDDAELVFALDQAALDARLAVVRVRLVDRDTGVAVVDAEAELKAERSAHRRRDLQRRAPDDDGELVFQRVIPGAHELTVTRGANVAQRKLTVAAGQELDLGALELGAGPGLRLRTVDADGRPVQAIVELAPYERGRHVDELYHPNLWRKTDADGVYELPVPDRPSIVRCRRYLAGGTYTPVATRNVLVDPEALPSELGIALVPPVEVRFDPAAGWGLGHALLVEDELGLVVAVDVSSRDAVRLVPGRYVVRHVDDGEELGNALIVVPARDVTLQVP